MTATRETIVAFHIGRGGRFNNSGYLSFIGKGKIGDFTDNLYPRFEKEQDFKERFGYGATGSTQKCIQDLISDKDFYELEEKFGITEEMLGEEIYVDGNGSPVGLTQADVDGGIGKINIDYDYDTTYTTFLGDCTEAEIEAIKRSSVWNKEALLGVLEEEVE